ncbi:MAG TPA: carboxymuconolactone decarboxylase family protein [Polyangiaceae bacterium]
MNKTPETYERGERLLARLHGGHAGEVLVREVAEVCPDFATMTIEWALAGVMARPLLDLRTRQYIVIAACVTLGHAAPQLRAHIEAALALGASRDEIVEVILQTLFYAGGAATANALSVAKSVFALALSNV